MQRTVLFLAGLLTFYQLSGQDVFLEHRKAFIQKLKPAEAAVLRAADVSSQEGCSYVQDPDFYYLTGCNQPATYLIVAEKALLVGTKACRTILFSQLGNDQGCANAADTLLDLKDFQAYLKLVASQASLLYVSQPGFDFVADWLNARPLFIGKDSRKQFAAANNGLVVKPLGNLLSGQRQLKSNQELEWIQQAIKATEAGLRLAMQECKPGAWEYQLQAAVEYGITYNGCRHLAFSSIIGSGVNGLELHYDRNDCMLKSGDLVVMDVGGNYRGYCADITRTIPVSGTFTPDQARYYNIVLQVQKELIASLKPGFMVSDIDRLAAALFEKHGLRKYLIHGVTHSLGIDVHDAMQAEVLAAGMVITIEPGLYIPSDDSTQAASMRGNGIRIEDDVLITETGSQVLSTSVPKEVAEIEALMKE